MHFKWNRLKSKNYLITRQEIDSSHGAYSEKLVRQRPLSSNNSHRLNCVLVPWNSGRFVLISLTAHFPRENFNPWQNKVRDSDLHQQEVEGDPLIALKPIECHYVIKISDKAIDRKKLRHSEPKIEISILELKCSIREFGSIYFSYQKF